MLRVVTWNVNSITVRLDRLLALLKRWNPDVVMLQELKCTEDKFPFEAIQEAGYHSAVFGQKTYNGVAILTKHPLNNVRSGWSDFYQDPAARIIQGELHGISFVCCYVPNGQEVGSEKYIYKLEWLEALKKLLTQTNPLSRSVILAGDFNIAPDDRDVHDPKSWKDKILCSDKERAAYQDLINLGLEDTFRKHHQEDGLFSWWDYRALGFQKNHGLRIDLILSTPKLMENCVSCLIDREERKGEKPSDHAPVIADFNISIPKA